MASATGLEAMLSHDATGDFPFRPPLMDVVLILRPRAGRSTTKIPAAGHHHQQTSQPLN